MNRLQIQLGFVLILLALLTGFGMPVFGAGTTGDELSEAMVSFLLISVSLAALAGTVLAVWGFRKAAATDARTSIAAGLPSPPV